MAKFELNRLLEYSDKEILDEIKKVAELLNVNPLTIEAFQEVSKVSAGPIRRRFGSWKEALELAGVGHLYSGLAVSPKMRTQENRYKSNEELLQNLRDVAASLGRNDLSTSDLMSAGSVRGDNIYYNRFGSWKQALALAGLRQRQPGMKRRVFSDEQMFANLRQTWEHHGRQPHYSEMNEPPSTIKAKTYWNRFGTWRKALLAFIGSIEQDATAESGTEDAESVEESPQPADSTASPSGTSTRKGNARSMSLGLRFRVLYRDNFKCVLCGNSPSLNPGLVLHVDHIMPWSKGGKTELANLRTLCGPCNLGRGNSYAD